MLNKYKLGDLAKDLDMQAKDISAILKDKLNAERASGAILELDELDIIFQTVLDTRKPKPEALLAYFAAANEPRAKEPEKPAEPEKKPEKPAEKQAKPEQKPEQKEGKPAQQGAAIPPRPQKQDKPKGERPIRGAQTVRVVDTKSGLVGVNLARYDERIDNLVPERQKELSRQKQKVGKKQGFRRPVLSRKDTEAEKMKRIAFEKARNAQLKITIPDEITVGELATRLKKTAAEVIKKLMSVGVMANVTETVDYDTAAIIADEFGAKVEREVHVTIEERLHIAEGEDEAEGNVVPRPPVVVVMGHVDHGKTSLLDAFRHSDVAAGEAGGITQHIGAYQVKLNDRLITFLDTPGHEAFTAMRARGAQATDIAILVVAADDGVMPQTVEAINHAKAAGVSVIVAINKIDRPGANPERVKQELTEYGIVPEEWGGENICVPVSAKTREGLDTLLEMLLLTADVKDFKANPDRPAKGIVIEARLDKGRGPVATLLVQNGTLRAGDIIIAGKSVGRVRALTNDRGATIEEAGPSTPVEITGLAEVPETGDVFNVVADESLARKLVEQRRVEEREHQSKNAGNVTLEDLFSRIQEGMLKDLNIIVKADVQGSVEAVSASLQKISNEEVRVNIIHGGVGAVNESDVMLASASNAIIVGFNVRPDATAAETAKANSVDIRLYRVIYQCIEEIEAAMKGMMAPKFREVVGGHAEVRQTFKVSKLGVIAGCYVTDGTIVRGSKIRVLRDNVVVAEDEMDSLRRVKDDVKEVKSGFECGIKLEKFNDIKEGDVLEAFTIEEYRE
ncbi:MAG: translation initiation factor IF-2 [Clostridia bacterium]|nr:translation initiation factor IF-2 [Clostridia bacterium]